MEFEFYWAMFFQCLAGFKRGGGVADKYSPRAAPPHKNYSYSRNDLAQEKEKKKRNHLIPRDHP